MKRILSIFAVVAMLASLFCVNVSAAVPTTTGGEWTVLISDNFDGEKATYFTRTNGDVANVTNPAEAEGSENKVIDLKMGTAIINDVEVPYDGAQIGAGNYTGSILGGYGENTIYMPNSTVMIEFDMCGKNLASPLHIGMRVNKGSGKSVKINPNNIDADTWYTFRIVVERSADTDAFTIDNTTVYRKLRGSNDDFVKIEGADTPSFSDTTNLDYAVGQSPGASIVSFAVTAHNSYVRPYHSSIAATTKGTGTSNGTTTNINYVPEVKDAHYQIDNVTVYAKADEKTYELSKGVLTNWTMEPGTTIYTTGQVYEDGKWNTYTFNTVQAEESGNNFIKYDASVAEYAATRDYLAKFPLDVALPETFILSFDANNASLGAALDIVISGDSDGITSGSYPRNTLYFRSHEGIENTWYSYKVVCSATPKQAGDFSFTVYRKERGSDAPYTKLEGVGWAGKDETTAEKDYGWASTMSGSLNWNNTLQIGHNRRGLLSYYTKTYVSNTNTPVEAEEKLNHDNVAWYIDNVMITEANAITADFAVAENVLSADVNLSTATATSAPVLAVYDGGRLVDVDFDALSHTGSAALAVDYDASALTAPTAQFLVWENIGGAPLVEEIDIASYIAE